jgi:3-(3-hydroxy-phenyl)propionate hydroxylase
MNDTTCDVLIVGMGPVGAAMANLLGRYGVRTLVVDKATEIFKAPRAIALDNEALRVLQMCGLQEGDIDTVAIPEVRMHSPLFGQYSRAVTAGATDGHPKLVTFYQPQLEAVLRERLNRYPCIQVTLGTELSAFEQREDGIEATLQDPQGQTRHIRARYLVGADGANSVVRRLLGQEFKGKTYAEDWLVVDARHVAQPIDHVEFICDPQRPTPHMVAPGARQRWEFKLQPGETREQMEHPDTVRRLLAPWTQGRDIEIERVAVYRFHARVADTFQVGHAFLVGDAAHITPPFVGQGLVAGLRDVANLAWKLAWVIQGRARAQLLSSYTLERQPHVKSMIQLAQWMGRLVMPRNTASAFLAHGLMRTAHAIPRLRHLFERLEIKPANRFKTGCFLQRMRGSPLHRGGQAPQAWLREAGTHRIALSDEALGTGFAMVGFGVDPRAGLSPQQIRRWESVGGQFVRINARGDREGQGQNGTWEDFNGSMLPQVVQRGWVGLIRPDKVVMHDGPAQAGAHLLEQALALFVPPSCGPAPMQTMPGLGT